jgi:hypothetical protein
MDSGRNQTRGLRRARLLLAAQDSLRAPRFFSYNQQDKTP